MIGLTAVYGTLAVSRVCMQIATSHIERKKRHKLNELPHATLIVPVYNEEPSLLSEAFLSFSEQAYPDIEVIVVDDGSDNHELVEKLSKKYGFKYLYQENAGKRMAMYRAFTEMSPSTKVVLTADSDTIWHKNAALWLARTLLSDNNVGAVTGEVSVANYDDNFLTRLISIRYYLAFVHERASQSYFSAVTCVSGPLGAYRRDLIDLVKNDFINQYFLGNKCTYGDDRHLTNLILNEGYKIKFNERAVAWTHVPTSFFKLVKQQNRWSKSYWREIIWQIRVLPKHGPYLTYDLIISAILPILLLFTAGGYMISAAQGSSHAAISILLTILFMSLLRILEPMIKTKNPIFLIFLTYSFIYFAVMLPVKFYALATLNDTKWGTR